MQYMTDILIAWALLIAIIDFRTRRIPNVLSLSAVVVGIAALILEHKSLAGAAWTSALAAGGVALLLTVPGYLLNKLGAGDVKLLLAMGVLSSMTVLLITYAVGALVAVLLYFGTPAMMALRRAMSITFNRPAWMPMQTSQSAKPIPYGVGLGLGFALALLLNR